MGYDLERQQQGLLTIIVRLTNIIVIMAVVVNSYFLLSDFWPTLAQNMAALAIVAIGWWCLRLSRRGQRTLAIRLYLIGAMLFNSVLIPVFSEPFVLNGALALALFLLIAAYLDEPDNTLYWGAASIAFFWSGLTLRILGPFEGLQMDSADLVALYLLPALALVAIALLGRYAAGRLNEALGESEAARRELERSHKALQASETDLSASHRKLQLELAERKRAEQALHVSVEATARDQRLLLALSQAAQKVQQARSTDGVYQTLGEEIRELGYGSIVLRPSDDGSDLEIAHVSFDRSQRMEASQLLGFAVMDYRIKPAPGSIVRRVLEEGKTLLTDRYVDYVVEAFPEKARTQAREMVKLMGMEQAITAPLYSDDQAHGLLIVTGTGLTEDDRQAVSAFANQAATALKNVELLQEVQGWAAQLEHRVEERTAELAASEARYRRLFDSNRDGLYIFDLEGKILDANAAGCEMLGYDRQGMLALDVFAIDSEAMSDSPERQAQFQAELQHTMREGTLGLRRTAITRTGDSLPIEMNVTRLIYQGKEAVLAAVRDISEQKRAEEELHQSRAEIVQSHRRLLALSQSAQAVQRAKSRDEVYRIIGDEVKKLGFQVIVLRTTAQPSRLAISYWTFESALLHVVEKVVGQATQDVRIWLDPDEALQRVMSQGESVFFEDTAQRIGRGLPSLGRAIVKRVVAILEIDRCIYAPIEIGGNTTGILVVAGRDLDENDVPAVAILANQAGIAIENLQLLEEQRASQARMQNLARQVVSAQEEERQRLSRVLHDESGQALTALKISLELIAQDLPAQQELVSKRILDAAKLTDSTMERIREMAQDLRPPALDTVGLLATLEGLCEDFAGRTKIWVDLQAEELTGLPEPVSITLFRIVQEALTNVARHAKASQVRVALRQDDGAIRLQVEDNGTGFLPEALPTPAARGAGMGLEGIRERLESLGGRLELASQPGHGSRLTAIIPVREASTAR